MFKGREEELSALASLWDKSTSSLVTCRGRRRIGKSSLIEEFARRTADAFVVLEGIAPRKGLSDRQQRAHFCEQLSVFAQRRVRATSWILAFQALDAALPSTGRTVVLLDEISWMGAYNPDFAGILKIAWDRFFSKRERLVVVLCGSVSAWIAQNILNSTGFVGRNSLDLELGELPFPTCMELLGPLGRHLSVDERIDFLSVTGGVPKYLLEIHPEYSVEENVRRMCFMRNGLLFREFDETFASVFGRATASRRKALENLADRPVSVSEFAVRAHAPASGRISKILQDLQHAGFVGKDAGLNPMTGEPLRQERYRISDNYTRFFLKCIEPHRQSIEQGLFRFASLEQLANWDGIMGLQFENLVVGHKAELFPLLGLDRSLILSAAPYIRRPKSGEGLQIDLLIQTKKSFFVVEVKRRRRIPYEVVDEVERKVKLLPVPADKSIRTALVYSGELDRRIETDHGFDFIIPASRLVGGPENGRKEGEVVA